MYRYFKKIGDICHIVEWKSKALSEESITPPARSNNILNPLLNFLGTKTRIEFNGSCLKQDKTTYTHKAIVHIYIVYEIVKILI